MKKVFFMSLVTLLALLCFAGCNGSANVPPETSGDVVEPGTSSTEITTSEVGETTPEQTTPTVTTEKVYVAPDSDTATAIHANQIGYIPGQVKRAIVVGGGKEFYVVDGNTGEAKYQGLVEKGSNGVDKYSGDVVCYADFTEFDTPGYYYLYIPNGNVFSYPFNIGNDVYEEIAKASLNSFYTQRCGETLLKEYAGVNARAACHTYGSDYMPTNGRSRQVIGGWHDAGDCGCYTNVTAMVVETMCTLYQMMPEAYGDDTNIPEAGNGVSDLLDEVRIGIDWLFQMQDTDGGVYHCRGNNGPAGIDHISVDRTMYYIWPKTADATYCFVAAMNEAYKVFKDVDPEYAEKCKNAALASEEWALAYWGDDSMLSGNIRIPESKWWPNEKGGAIAYWDQYSLVEEEMHAAFAFYELTGNQEWHEKFIAATTEKTGEYWRLDYANYSTLTMYKYLMSDVEKNEQLVRTIERRFTRLTRDIENEFDSMPYRIANSGDKFGWGSNSELTGQLICLILMDDYFGKTGEHDEMIVESVDYILGKNAVGYCFITGYGSNPVLYMHHRATYGTNNILPGYMVSGPVRYETAVVSHKVLTDPQYGLDYSTPPLKSFYDKWEFYRFTETDVSRMVQASFVLSYVSGLGK
jgi:endoglucanase